MIIYGSSLFFTEINSKRSELNLSNSLHTNKAAYSSYSFMTLKVKLGFVGDRGFIRVASVLDNVPSTEQLLVQPLPAAYHQSGFQSRNHPCVFSRNNCRTNELTYLPGTLRQNLSESLWISLTWSKVCGDGLTTEWHKSCTTSR